MKKNIYTLISLILVIFFSCNFVFCEPFLLEQASNVVKMDQFEVGLDIAYTYDNYEIQGTGIEYLKERWETYLQLKYGLKEKLELKTSLPYIYRIDKQSNQSDQYNNGLGNTLLGLKLNFIDTVDKSHSVALGVNFEYPSGNSERGLGEGLNYEFKLIVDEIIKPFNIHLDLGYKITGEYTNQSKTKIDPGDLFLYGVSLESNMEDNLIPGGNTYLILEVIGTSFKNYKVLGLEYQNTGGTTLEIIPAIRYNTGNLKTKVGMSFSLGDVTYRAYAWKLLGGISYLFQL